MIPDPLSPEVLRPRTQRMQRPILSRVLTLVMPAPRPPVPIGAERSVVVSPTVGHQLHGAAAEQRLHRSHLDRCPPDVTNGLAAAAATLAARTMAVVSAARNGHPYAYGRQHLQTARAKLADRYDRITSPMDGATDAIVGDPGEALRDLDRAIEHVAERPAPRPTLRETEPAPTNANIHAMYQEAVRMEYPTLREIIEM
jgi:hypothetical protein